MPVTRCILLAILLCGGASVGQATLPANVGQYVHVPKDQVSSVSIPLLFSNATINPTDPSMLPLIIMAIDSSDPFTSYMTTNNKSIDRFLQQVPFVNTNDANAPLDNSRFLFSAWDSLESVVSFAHAITNRLSIMPPQVDICI